MSNYDNYQMYLKESHNMLEAIASFIHYKLETKEYSFLKRTFIREMVKILKNKNDYKHYLMDEDIFSTMKKNAEKKHEERILKKPYLFCDHCGCIIQRNWFFYKDKENNVYCSTECVLKAHNLEDIHPSHKNYDFEYNSTALSKNNREGQS